MFTELYLPYLSKYGNVYVYYNSYVKTYCQNYLELFLSNYKVIIYAVVYLLILISPPETVTISSDEEDMSTEPGRPLSAPATPVSGNRAATPGSTPARSPCRPDGTSVECPESPLIPNIPISSRPELMKSRVGKMENKVGFGNFTRKVLFAQKMFVGDNWQVRITTAINIC